MCVIFTFHQSTRHPNPKSKISLLFARSFLGKINLIFISEWNLRWNQLWQNVCTTKIQHTYTHCVLHSTYSIFQNPIYIWQNYLMGKRRRKCEEKKMMKDEKDKLLSLLLCVCVCVENVECGEVRSIYYYVELNLVKMLDERHTCF